ncbi:MAG TPA: HD domain-containing protein [Haloplasmataceae bacterium]
MKDLFSLEVRKIQDVVNKENISLYARIESLNVLQTVNQTDFLNLLLVDDTGFIYAKKWDVTEEDKKTFKAGQVVYISGYGNEYNNKLQLIIEEMRLIDKNDNVDLSHFYTSAPLDKDVLDKKILSYIDKIENKVLKDVTSYLYKKYQELYLLFPAASKNHHAYISGLAYHVSTMLDLAYAIGKIYPNINMSLVYSGIILHDIGKVIELSDYLAPEYTIRGKLIGHINISFEEIKLAAQDLNYSEKEEILLLQHLVLAHHGLLEYGSPKRPLIIEAEIVHLIDLIDSRINMIDRELEVTPINEFTKRISSLDARSFYKHNIE